MIEKIADKRMIATIPKNLSTITRTVELLTDPE